MGYPYSGIGIFFALGIYPLLDVLLGDSEGMNLESGDPDFFDMILYFHVLFQALCFVSLFYTTKKSSEFPWLSVLSTGINSGISGIVIAHELIHRKHVLQRYLGIFSLWTVNYMHFYVEHIRRHHKDVGTDLDPASARYEDGLFWFSIKTIPSQWWSAFTIMRERSGIINLVIAFMFLQLISNFTIYVLLGEMAFLVALSHSLLAILLLEFVNYIRHWGLRRDPTERVAVADSWQSNARWSRWTLIELTRHADHHYLASREYWKLKFYEESPSLPGGYYACFYLALCPPFWRRIAGRRLPKTHH